MISINLFFVFFQKIVVARRGNEQDNNSKQINDLLFHDASFIC
ncbi:hypothetical protein SDC9_67706 [bioreactor metagenome]|uniref:Uncharacterized protein n=1 Tax=bioreactor metagenome TaxID=1076179 RepID=A0A644XYB4_9ZZZZ